jgi:hypothetical protein
MDENKVLQVFERLKIMTIDQLAKMLQSSAITVRRRLKKWNSYTSINRNGRYYTLPRIAQFDVNGLWRYQSVLFSEHGNLKQTIVWLIGQSQTGLTAGEIAKIVDLSPSSSLFTQVHKSAGISRERYGGRFVYYSGSPERYHRQKQERIASRPKVIDWPSDACAVMILVELIKHPGIDIEELAVRVAKQGYPLAPDGIGVFLRSHGLLKKTSDTEQ